ncbi:glycosyltransferase, partial [Rhodobacteraceae bacterium N5(2021)]
MTSDLAIIIPHFNDVDRLTRCLAALEPQDRTGVEVVVADNASTQDLEGVKTRFDWVQFVVQPEAGAGPARNAGVAASTAPWLAFLDADCVPGPDWVSRALHNTLGRPEIVTGGRVEVFDETPPPRSGAEAFETVFAFDQEGYIRDRGFSVTANLVASRAMFDRTGPFLVGVSEDRDWCLRATAKGAHLFYAPDLRVGHPTRTDWPSLERKWQRMNYETFGFYLRNARFVLAARGKWGLRAFLMPL